MKTEKKNLRRISIVVTAQTKGKAACRLRRKERGLQLGRCGVDCDGSTCSWEQGGH